MTFLLKLGEEELITVSTERIQIFVEKNENGERRGKNDRDK